VAGRWLIREGSEEGILPKELGLLEGDEEGRVETLGNADGELEGPVDGPDEGPEEGALLKILGLFKSPEEG
jgi:hypothetical protein